MRKTINVASTPNDGVDFRLEIGGALEIRADAAKPPAAFVSYAVSLDRNGTEEIRTARSRSAVVHLRRLPAGVVWLKVGDSGVAHSLEIKERETTVFDLSKPKEDK